MSATRTTTRQQSDRLLCSKCQTLLPRYATFCGTCGERVIRTSNHIPSPNEIDIVTDYRIKTLLRRRPYVQIYLATYQAFQRPVVIRDIDISSLDGQAHSTALQAAQDEYDLLRSQPIPGLMPVIDLRYYQDHLYTVAGWPFVINKNGRGTEKAVNGQYFTLQDLLQSGVGLPPVEVVINWVARLCRTLGRLHQRQIVIGDLDPQTIIVSSEYYQGQAALMVSWLPSIMRDLLSGGAVGTAQSPFVAPEVLEGELEPRSDIYSLGALLYLLLTGVSPGEQSVEKRLPLRSPREFNARISPKLEEIVMRALSVESTERFLGTEEMTRALLNLSSKKSKRTIPLLDEEEEEEGENGTETTISIIPLAARQARWQQIQRATDREAKLQEELDEGEPTETMPSVKLPKKPLAEPEEPKAEEIEEAEEEREEARVQPAQEERKPLSLRERITGKLPALPRVMQALVINKPVAEPQEERESLFKRMQRVLLGEQRHSTAAAALIETPLRIQPDQNYSLRIHVTGRDHPVSALRVGRETLLAGLSDLSEGDGVLIEIRSMLLQNRAYIVQQAEVKMPGEGFAAEVTIPMPPPRGMSGRRERLYVFFMDAERNPLYEKPFVVEFFVSHLVQAGREGHNVLPIPV